MTGERVRPGPAKACGARQASKDAQAGELGGRHTAQPGGLSVKLARVGTRMGAASGAWARKMGTGAVHSRQTEAVEVCG
jgi:hypothetical protein